MNGTDMHNWSRLTICVVASNFCKGTFITELAWNHFAFQRVHGIGHDVHRQGAAVY